MGVTLRDVIKKYGETQVIHGIDLDIEEGEFAVFVGPSGCGKSTLLRMIAGLEETTGGKIDISGRDVTHLEPSDRGVAMVFQTYALYPHMTVEQNMGFGLKMNGAPKAEIDQKVAQASDILKLGPYLKRKPAALSGGQRQRVAIGRSIVRDPKVFLFDEPLSNLDAELRVEMRVEIARLHNEIGATMIYVTHDQVEAMTLADKIVVLRDGRIEQVGRPLDLYDDPDNQFVAGFIGSPSMNFLPGTAANGAVEIPELGMTIPVPAALPPAGTGITVGLRPEHLEIVEGDALHLDLIEHLGGTSYMHLDTQGGTRLIAEARSARDRQRGARLALSAPTGPVFLFDPGTGRRIR